jgi:hypothetical protein
MTWAKLILNPLSQVHTLAKAGSNLLNFTAIMGVLLFGFAVIGHLNFGHVLVKEK